MSEREREMERMKREDSIFNLIGIWYRKRHCGFGKSYKVSKFDASKWQPYKWMMYVSMHDHIAIRYGHLTVVNNISDCLCDLFILFFFFFLSFFLVLFCISSYDSISNDCGFVNVVREKYDARAEQR